MPRAKKISVERVKEVLDYNPETGSLTWKKNTAKWDQIGKEAGFKPAKNGYRYVSLDRGDYLAQRLAWIIMNGEFPENHVVFKDGNKLNLKWENLIEKKIMHKSKFDHSTKEGRSAFAKVYRAENFEKFKDSNLRKNFGIDLKQYQRMFAAQNGICAICECEETATRNGKALWLSVDHDHENGEVRSLLCKVCNTGLGAFSDKTETMEKAIAYIKHHKSKPKEQTNVVVLKRKEK